MNIERRQFLSLSATAITCTLFTGHSWAQDYPLGPVRIVVGFSPGGTADVVARTIGNRLTTRLGQAFVVENRAGGSSNIATETVVRAPADGNTLLLTTTSNLLNGTLFEKLNYDFVRDIAPVASIMQTPLVLVVHPDVPVGTVPELIAYAKANPGKVNMANFGVGTVSHLAGELFKIATGIDFVHVPYAGSAPMLLDLLAGRVHASFDNIPASLAHIRAGKLRVLAVTTKTRSEALPEVPTVAEFLPGFEVRAVVGVGAPRGTPANIINKLNDEINSGLADPNIASRLSELGGMVFTGSPTDFSNFIASETEKWAKMIKSSNIKLN